MNNERRKIIKIAIKLLEEATEHIEQAANEERDAFDNLPEGIQVSEKGEDMGGFTDTLDEVLGNIQFAASDLEGVI